MNELATGSARIRWSQMKFPYLKYEKRMLVIDAAKANPRSHKHAQVMLSEFQVEQLKKFLAEVTP